MKFNYKVTLSIFLVSQILIVLLSLLIYQNIFLLHYINLSFYISVFQLMISIMIFTINTGFFDITAKSFRMVFLNKNSIKEDKKEITPLSQIFTFNYLPLLISGILNLLLMLVGLSFYYN
jgi:hypothetical protein